MTRQSVNKGRQLQFVREYRGFSQSKLSKEIAGLSQSNLSRFEKGFNTLSDELLKMIMKFLDWPLEFLDVEKRKLSIYTLDKTT